MSLEDTIEADRQWFIEHPQAIWYFRRPTEDELDEIINANPQLDELIDDLSLDILHGKVQVILVKDGQVRDFSRLYFAPKPL